MGLSYPYEAYVIAGFISSNAEIGSYVIVFLSLYYYNILLSYQIMKRGSEWFDRRYSVARIVEAYLSHASSEGPKEEQKLLKRLRFLLIQKMIAPRAFAIAANGDLIIYWKEPYIKQKLAPFIYPIPYWIAPLENWRKKPVSKKSFSWKDLRILKPAPVASAVTVQRAAGMAAVSDQRKNGAADGAQKAGDASGKSSLKGIPRSTRIPLEFIKSDPQAYIIVLGMSFARAFIYGMVAPTIWIGMKTLFPLDHPVVGNVLYSTYWFARKSENSFGMIKRHTESFDSGHSVARILEAYLSHASSEGPKGEQKLSKRLRFLLLQKMIAPRAFAIAANGDLLVYWKEPYVMKKLVPFIYPIPYWIAPLEGWRKKLVRHKSFSWKDLRILKPAPVVSAVNVQRAEEIYSGADQSMKGGIDLDLAQMSLRVEGQGEDFKFDLNGFEIDAARVSGVTFIIRQMAPATSILVP